MTIGTRVYGLAAVILGILGLVFGSFAVLGQPVPPHLPGYQILAYAAAALLVLAGLAACLPRIAAIGSLALAAFFALCLILLQLPHAAMQPLVWVSWEDVAENVVKLLGGVLAFAWAAPAGEARAAAIMRIARPLFGACLIVFGISEFVYAGFTAAMVPAWLPPSQLAWAWVTGACQIAAGLAVASGIKARLAAILVTAMYLGFGLLVHLPRVIADPSGAMAWAENGTNLVLAGAAWLLADSLGRAGARRR
jgi:uncharacterized membrane protein YphA (DoxX/SURF4 family)